MNPVKLVRITTVPVSLDKLLTGQLKYMGQNGFEVTMVSSAGSNTGFLEQREECVFVPVEMTRTISPVKDALSLLKLVRLLRKLKPTIVHTHTPKAGLLGMVAAKIAGVPIRMHTVAGLPLMETTGTKRKILEQVEKVTCACAHGVYPVSKKLSEFIISNGFCKANKLKVIGQGSSNGINTSHFELTEELKKQAEQLKRKHNIAPDDFVFLFIGRVVKDKGIEELAASFDQLQVKYPNLKLLIVGPFEDDLDPISASAKSILTNNPNVINVGYQQDVKPYLAVSTALAFPSYREGFPNVPMQAGCFNLPSVVTDINGCNEIIEEGVNGLIIPAKDANALKNAMERLVTDTELYAKMEKNARQMIVDRYEQKDVWKLLLAEYQNHLKAL